MIPGSGALFGAPSDLVSLSNEKVEIREQAVFGEASYDIFPSSPPPRACASPTTG